METCGTSLVPCHAVAFISSDNYKYYNGKIQEQIILHGKKTKKTHCKYKNIDWQQLELFKLNYNLNLTPSQVAFCQKRGSEIFVIVKVLL